MKKKYGSSQQIQNLDSSHLLQKISAAQLHNNSPPSPPLCSNSTRLPTPNSTTRKMPGGYRSFSFQHLTSLSIVLILAITSTVSLSNIAFVLLSIPYLLLLSTITFPPPPSPPPPVFSPNETRVLTFYVSIGALVGLLFPLLQIIHSVVVKNTDTIATTAPHLFLLCAQIFLEGVSFGYDFSLPARAAVPIMYNTKRLFTIADWVRHEVGGGLSVGCVISMANLVFWAFNLLGFLLPVYLPRTLKLHYGGERGNKTS